MNRSLFRFNTLVWKNNRFSTCQALCKQTSISHQGRIFGKLFGKRVPGSKKRWVENSLPSQSQQASPFQFAAKKTDLNSNRRATILNKLFMCHITDLLATGGASTKITGKGLQITRVKVASNFQVCNVYWTVDGDTSDSELEEELQKCGGLLRHELSQLRLMGEVPRIHFVKDKTHANLALVESILKECDFGSDTSDIDPSLQQPSPLHSEWDADEEPLPPMRHDIFGLDHRKIMLKILSRMKKSEQTWETQEFTNQESLLNQIDEIENDLIKDEEKVSDPEKDKAFKKFLSSLAANEKRRKGKFYRTDDGFYRRIGEDENDPLEDGDYIEDGSDEK